MPIPLPNLDDLRWKDLVEEGRSLIPAAAQTWTNHNPSDPGITLIELFAFVSGTLMYQLNRITEADTAHFLSLLNADRGRAQADPSVPTELRATFRAAGNVERKRRAFRDRSRPLRAVTAADFESLVCAMAGVARARCLTNRNLENEDPGSRWAEAPGHVSVVVLPLQDADPDAEPLPGLLAEVRQALEPARLLTTRVHAVAPRLVPVSVQLSLVAARNSVADDVLRNRVADTLRQFLDPYRGWFDGTGWPLGRDLHISELYQRVGGIAGIESVGPRRNADGVFEDEITVGAEFSERMVRDPSGRVQAFALRDDELLKPQIEVRSIEIVKHPW